MSGDISVLYLISGVFICVISYYSGLLLLEFIKSRNKRKKRKSNKKNNQK